MIKHVHVYSVKMVNIKKDNSRQFYIKNNNIKTVYYDRHFNFGGPQLLNIELNINNSQTSLLLGE